MNAVETVILFVLSGLIGGFFALFIYLFSYGRTTSGTGEAIDRAEESNTDAIKSVNDARRTASDIAATTGDIRNTVEKLSESVEGSRDIFKEIRNQKLDD